MNNVITFLTLLLDKWVALTTGSVVIALLAFWERYHHKPIQWKTFFTIGLLAIFVACYQVWLDEYKSSIRKDQTIVNLRASGQNGLVTFPLTLEQEKRLGAELDNVAKDKRFSIKVLCPLSAALYANKMAKTFRDHGWDAKSQCTFLIVATGTGIAIALSRDVMSGQMAVSNEAVVLTRLLDAAKIEYGRVEFEDVHGNDYWFIVALPESK